MDLRHARIIAYDIEDDRTRQQVARLLEHHGLRIQKSVFLVNLSGPKLAQLQKKLAEMCRDCGLVDIIPVCGTCRARSVRIGPVVPPAIVVLGGEQPDSSDDDAASTATG